MDYAERPLIGISSCLLGQKVRYDGTAKRNSWLVDQFGKHVDYRPICPEMAIGMPTPRPPIRLVGTSEDIRVVGVDDPSVDVTGQLEDFALSTAGQLQSISAYVFMSKSPSCGMERVKVYNEKGMPSKSGTGIFAGIFKAHFPLLPVEDEGRLHDPVLRENFIESIFALKRWREVTARKRTIGGLVEFHTRNKLLILSHSPKHYREMGKRVADGKRTPVDRLFSEYEAMLLEALRLKSTVRKNVNVLQHMMGYFKKDLTPDEKKELLEVIEDYRNGRVPLIVPITLFNHYVRKYKQPYLAQQTYLNPHPAALKLRNHV